MAESYSIRVALIGGTISLNVCRWCAGLSQAGADVYVITFDQEPAAGVTNIRLPIPKLPGKLHYFAAVPHTRRILKRIAPDVTLAYYVTGYGTLAALTGFRPLVQVAVGSDILVEPQKPVKRVLVRYALGCADSVVCWAPHIAEMALALGVAPDRIFTLTSGIPLSTFDNVRTSCPAQGSTIRLICTRSLRPYYRIDTILHALRLLVGTDPNYHLTIAGDGPQRQYLESLTRELRLETQVHFAGFVPNKELPHMLAQHHIYISLPPTDGVSASLLEAMAVGLLPIVVDNPANRAWIRDGENGCLVREVTPQAVSEIIANATSDWRLRERAWLENLKIVRTKGDLHKNSQAFLDHFRHLANVP